MNKNRLCGVTRQTVYRWLKETGQPSWATQVGAIAIVRATVEAIREKRRRIERQDQLGGRFLRLQEERRLARLKRGASELSPVTAWPATPSECKEQSATP